MSYSVLTFNVLGNPTKPRHAARMALLPEALAELQPDVVLLQELDWPDEQATACALHITRKSGRNYQPYLAPLIAPNGWQEALAIITHLPVENHEMLVFPEGEAFCHRVVVDLHGMPLGVSNCHLDPYSASRRATQIEMMASWMSGQRAALVGGDFNTTPDEPALQPLRSQLDSAFFTMHGSEPKQTTPTLLLPDVSAKVVDYLWHSPLTSVTDARVVFDRPRPDDPELYLSDHVGLLVCFERVRMFGG